MPILTDLIKDVRALRKRLRNMHEELSQTKEMLAELCQHLGLPPVYARQRTASPGGSPERSQWANPGAWNKPGTPEVQPDFYQDSPTSPEAPGMSASAHACADAGESMQEG